VAAARRGQGRKGEIVAVENAGREEEDEESKGRAGHSLYTRTNLHWSGSRPLMVW